MIAGLPQAPSEYNPFMNPKAALQRRNEVLLAMEQQGYITPADYDQASQARSGLHQGHKYDTIREPYFFDYVQQQLIDKYGVNTVRNGGLKVYTTINPSLQADAQRAVDSCAVCYSGGGPQSALASIDATNGHILAMASSQPYSATSQFNFAADAHRQPGSSFKPYVLATAIRQGMDPDTTYYSGASPMTLTLPDGDAPGPSTTPSGRGRDPERPRGDDESVNVVFAQLDLDVGPENVRKMAYEMGITDPSRRHPGRGDRRSAPRRDAARAGRRLRDARRRRRPPHATAIAKVVFPNGDTDTPGRRAPRVFSDGIAYAVTDVLKGVITSGTGAGYTTSAARPPARPEPPRASPTRGSSATRRESRPRSGSGIPIARDATGFGGPTAGPIWQSYMEAAHGATAATSRRRRTRSSTRARGVVPHRLLAGLDELVERHGQGRAGPRPVDRYGSTTGKYPPSYYAPGAGQGPTPPANGGGGGNGGSGGSP